MLLTLFFISEAIVWENKLEYLTQVNFAANALAYNSALIDKTIK